MRTMETGDVTNTLNIALEASGCDQVYIIRKLRLLSDDGAIYKSGKLANYVKENDIGHALRAPYHPQTQDKIENWQQTLNNRYCLKNTFCLVTFNVKLEVSCSNITTSIITKKLEKRHAYWCLLRQRTIHFETQEKDRVKTIDHRRLQYRKADA